MSNIKQATMQQTSAQTKEQTEPSSGLALAFLAHAIWGTYPVMSKRMLSEVSTFSLLAVGYGIALLLSWSIWRNAFRSRPWQRRTWWFLMIVVSARAITNILSVNYTLAIYVQMINLSTPFAVALLGSAFFSEAIPSRTWSALGICTFGSSLMLFAGHSNEWRWSMQDTIGVGFALASTVCLAFYMLLTRYSQHTSGESSNHVFVHQALALGAVGLGASLFAGESWEGWTSLSLTGWGLFALFLGGNLIGGNLIQIAALARIPTARFSSLVGVRLIAALALGAILLGEELRSIWQAIGALMVLSGVTWYVSKKKVPVQPK